MDVWCLAVTPTSYGASAIYSFVGDLLTASLGDYGSAVESIHVTGCLPSPTGHASADFAKYLKTLPKVTFRRNLKRIEIAFRSTHFDFTDNRKATAEKSNLACEEVAAALPLIKKRIKPDDDFDVDRFLADATRLLATKIESLEGWKRVEEQAEAKRLAIRATKDPWDLLEIDWAQYHPKAREVLDDPFFWKNADDLAPNGNDTGADVLADYRRWDKRHRTKPPFDFLSQLLTRWDIEPIDWTITDEATVLRLNEEKPIALSVCNEAVIAVAFAVVKLRGSCPADVIEVALAALKRTTILVKHSSLSAEIKASWATAIARMEGKLQSLPEFGGR
jgi:uncharacterized protein YfeS